MELTEEFKNRVDNMSLEGLLSGWRHSPAGHPDFQGERGKYWGDVMSKKRSEDPGGWVSASKSIGWER